MAGTEQILEPGIDPRTKKIAVRGVFGRNEGGTRTVSTVRHFDPVVTDEPDSLGGTNSAPSPLEMVLVSLIGCEGGIIHGVAKAMNFKYAGVDFECSGKIDVRGPKGVRGGRRDGEEVAGRIMWQTDGAAGRGGAGGAVASAPGGRVSRPSDRATSCAGVHRAAGSFSRALRTAASTLAGIDGRCSVAATVLPAMLLPSTA